MPRIFFIAIRPPFLVRIGHYHVGGFAADDVQDCVAAPGTLIGGDRNAAVPADMGEADNVVHKHGLLDIFKGSRPHF